MRKSAPYSNDPTVEARVYSGMQYLDIEGPLSTERGIMLNTPGNSESQMNAGTAKFNYYTGVDTNGWGQNPWTSTGVEMPFELGDFVNAQGLIDSRPVNLFRGFIDRISGAAQSPTVQVECMDPVDAFDKRFSSPAFTSERVPLGLPGTWEGEPEDLLGSWNRTFFVNPATGSIARGVPDDFTSTLNANCSVTVPLLRALRRVGFGTTPSVQPGITIASVPFENSHHLNPEMGAYIKSYTDNSVTYGLTFNAWDMLNRQKFDLYFAMRADGSKITFGQHDGEMAVSVWWDSTKNGFVMRNEVTREQEVLTDAWLGPKSSYYHLSLTIERLEDNTTEFILNGQSNTVWDWTAWGGGWYRPSSSTDPIYSDETDPPDGFLGGGAPPFSCTDAVTGGPVGGVFEVTVTRSPDTSWDRAWNFGGFILNHVRGYEQPLCETFRQTFFTDNAFGGVGNATTPRFENVKVGDLVYDWCKAYCAPIWRSVNGGIVIKHHTFLWKKSTVEEDVLHLKTDADWWANSIAWESKMADKKAKVTIKYRKPIPSRSPGVAPTIIVANAQNTTTLKSGQTFTWNFKPEEGVDWIGTSCLASPGHTAQPMRYVDDMPAFTTVGATNADSRPSNGAWLLDQIDVRVYRSGVAGALVKVSNRCGYTMNLDTTVQTFNDDGSRGTPYRAHTPVVMAHTRVLWKDAERSSLTPPAQNYDEDTDTAFQLLPVIPPNSAPNNPPEGGGSSGSPGAGAGGGAPDDDYEGPRPEGEYSHEANWLYANLSKDEQDSLYRFLVDQTTGKTATATEIQVHPDPRMELGDAIKLSLSNSGEVLLYGRIINIRDEVSNGNWQQWIKVLPFTS